MMNDNGVCLFEYVGEVEKDRRTNLIFNVPAINATIATNLSNVENVHLQNVQVMQFTCIQTHPATWKPHSWNSICWGFFIVNDNLLVDLVNLQMSRCIIYRTK